MRFVLLSLAISASVLSDPCHVLPETKDEDFMRKTLVDLYNDPRDFFDSDVAKHCNLKYIDLVSITPPTSSATPHQVKYIDLVSITPPTSSATLFLFFSFTHAHTHTYYTYILTYIHTYLHTYIHTYILEYAVHVGANET